MKHWFDMGVAGDKSLGKSPGGCGGGVVGVSLNIHQSLSTEIMRSLFALLSCNNAELNWPVFSLH